MLRVLVLRPGQEEGNSKAKVVVLVGEGLRIERNQVTRRWETL